MGFRIEQAASRALSQLLYDTFPKDNRADKLRPIVFGFVINHYHLKISIKTTQMPRQFCPDRVLRRILALGAYKIVREKAKIRIRFRAGQKWRGV
jgi:hypothetical protein